MNSKMLNRKNKDRLHMFQRKDKASWLIPCTLNEYKIHAPAARILWRVLLLIIPSDRYIDHLASFLCLERMKIQVESVAALMPFLSFLYPFYSHPHIGQ